MSTVDDFLLIFFLFILVGLKSDWIFFLLFYTSGGRMKLRERERENKWREGVRENKMKKENGMRKREWNEEREKKWRVRRERREKGNWIKFTCRLIESNEDSCLNEFFHTKKIWVAVDWTFDFDSSFFSFFYFSFFSLSLSLLFFHYFFLCCFLSTDFLLTYQILFPF